MWEKIDRFFQSLGNDINQTLIANDRWQLYMQGLGNTLAIALGAMAVGFALGMLIAVVSFYNKRCGKFKALNKVFNIYIYIVRGTPVLLQLLIMWFVILSFIKVQVLVGIITFGLNSAAYVSEILRGGLEGVEVGQFEAGQSLGLSQNQTIFKIVVPQAFRMSLPPLVNEFITLIKETSVVGAIAVIDLTNAYKLIIANTASAFVPLIVSAIMYLILVGVITLVFRFIERRLTQNERTVNSSKKPA